MIVAVLELGDRLRVKAPAPAPAAPVMPAMPGFRQPVPVGAVPVRPPIRWFPLTAALQFACMLVIYVMVRLRWAG
jgi:hypothetical protein